MTIVENVPLAPFTTFKLGGEARFFCAARTERDVQEAINFAKQKHVPIFPLGGGSNVLIQDTGFPGLVVKIEMLGTQYDPDTGIMSIATGEVWDTVVAQAVALNTQGFEVLSYIPGTVGGAVVQNIGAYGSEICEHVLDVRALHSETGDIRTFSKEACDFRYRHSFFKTQEGKKWVVLSARFILKRNHMPVIQFKELQEYFIVKGIPQPTVRDVRNAVIEIRAHKLPDWTRIGTAGSFFKNPIIRREHYLKLQKQYPDVPGFVVDDHMIKVPLGWILDKVCGLKGYKEGAVGTYEKQALVLVHYGGGKSSDVAKLSSYIAEIVQARTGISIEPEVEFI